MVKYIGIYHYALFLNFHRPQYQLLNFDLLSQSIILCLNSLLFGFLALQVCQTDYFEKLLDNEDISTLSESDLAQIRGKKIGFIFQSFNLINNLTAKENVMIPMIFQGYEVEDRHYRADELMKMVDLSDRKNHSPNELSGGQQQRVAIARALANSPEVILADEPTGNLDSKTGGSVMDFLQDLNNKGKTIVMVTHDADLVKDYPDIVYWLRDGKVEKVTKGRSK